MERYKVVVTDEAKADIRAAARYLAVELRQPGTAEKLLEEFDSMIASPETLPERYGYVRDDFLASLGIRMAVIKGYLLFHLSDRDTHTVTILRALHRRRDWMSILTEEYRGA